MSNGIVKFFNPAKGFGFITPEGGGKDLFVQAAAVAASGIAGLKPGQRVAYETEPDTKGPKAVQLKLLAEAPVAMPPRPRAEAESRPEARPEAPKPVAPVLVLYCDPSAREADIVQDALSEAGCEAQLVDYIATPPTRDELRNLSLLLHGSDQSLTRRYDPLFLELRLDDRFISDNELWTGVSEHPTLINGPVLAMGGKARVCRTENAVRAFLGLEPKAAPRPEPVRPPKAGVSKPEPVRPAKTAEKIPAKATPAPVEEKKPKAQTTKTAVKPAQVAKSKAPAPKAVAKPAKKTAAKPKKKSAKK